MTLGFHAGVDFDNTFLTSNGLETGFLRPSSYSRRRTMQPRGRLDIAFSELLRAALPAGCVSPSDPPSKSPKSGARLSGPSSLCRCDPPLTRPLQASIGLSERSFSCRRSTSPTWVILSRKRGFRLVPLAVDPDTLAPDPQHVVRTIQRLRTRPNSVPIGALCLAHLFGSRIDLSPFIDIARGSGLQLWEDAAQAFCSLPMHPIDQPEGAPPREEADLSLTSFGLIKTLTALGGGIAHFRDVQWCERTKRLMESWPRQPEREFYARGVFAWAGPHAVDESLGIHPVRKPGALFWLRPRRHPRGSHTRIPVGRFVHADSTTACNAPARPPAPQAATSGFARRTRTSPPCRRVPSVPSSRGPPRSQGSFSHDMGLPDSSASAGTASPMPVKGGL